MSEIHVIANHLSEEYHLLISTHTGRPWRLLEMQSSISLTLNPGSFIPS